METTFDEIKKFDHLPDTMRTQNSAPLSIMEGCSKYCTYCVVPYTRGEEVSRTLDSILLELVNLIKNGATEIILLGQNVNAYTAVWEGRQIRLGDLIQIISEFERSNASDLQPLIQMMLIKIYLIVSEQFLSLLITFIFLFNLGLKF